MSGTFVISLDFELMWGVRDHRSVAEYGDAVLGGRKAIPEILKRFRESHLSATWAVVGFLFAQTRDELLAYQPAVLPQYHNKRLSPYYALDNNEIGQNEKDDPYHFGLSLINTIADTPGQEIGTHTYSHYYCLEPGASILAFDADLASACAIADEKGHTIQSIVYPRNQHSPEHFKAAEKHRVSIYRGEASGWLYKSRSEAQTTVPLRLMRFLDGAIPLSKKQLVEISTIGHSLNVSASRFLRPWSKRLGVYNALHIRRIQAEMLQAAQQDRIYHLWWHPHNFGRNTAINLERLDAIISAYRHCRDTYGMTSCSMRDVLPPATVVN